MKIMQYLDNKYIRAVVAVVSLFQLASCIRGYGQMAPVSQPELMDSLIKDSSKYHISYSGDKDKPGAVLFDPKSDNVNLERGEKWIPIEDKKQLESMVNIMINEYPTEDQGEKSTLNAVKGKDGNVIGYIFSPVTSKLVRPAGENSYSIDSVSTVDAENRSSGGGNDGGGSSGGCFMHYTNVLMADGSLKPINSINVGDAVMGYDTNKNMPVSTEVSKIFSLESSHYFDLNGLGVTGTHPFYTEKDFVKEVKGLNLKDKVLGDTDNNPATLEDITIDKKDLVKGKVKVFNMSVNGVHNFIVCDGNGKKYLVHNKGGGDR